MESGQNASCFWEPCLPAEETAPDTPWPIIVRLKRAVDPRVARGGIVVGEAADFHGLGPDVWYGS